MARFFRHVCATSDQLTMLLENRVKHHFSCSALPNCENFARIEKAFEVREELLWLDMLLFQVSDKLYTLESLER